MTTNRVGPTDVVASVASILNTYTDIFSDPYVTGSFGMGPRPSTPGHFSDDSFRTSNKLPFGIVESGTTDKVRFGARKRYITMDTFTFVVYYVARATHTFTDPVNSVQYKGKNLVVHYLDKVQRGIAYLDSVGSIPTLRNLRFNNISNPAQYEEDRGTFFALMTGTCQHAGSNVL